MTSPRLGRHSLRTRITLTTLIIFVTSMMALAYYASQTLRKDMEREQGDQQFLAATFMAADINGELDDRLRALEKVAEGIDPAVFGNPAALQAFLEQRPILTPLFNGGAFVVRIDGTATASIPTSGERVGINYMERDFIAAALKEGKSTISKPIMGKTMHSPLIVIGTPIRDTQGSVIGALAGVVDLGRPNFLNRLTNNTYGKTGGYLLIAPQYRLVVTATDPTRILTPLPDSGANAMIDRHLAGHEGTDVYADALGVEMLASARSVPVAGWYVLVTLPTEEAFAPVRDLQKRMLVAMLFLTLMAGALTWWLLRRQLLPMVEAAKTLAVRSGTNQPPQALPVTSNDEIGELISGFNGLLKIVGDRETGLRESETRFRRAIEEAPFPIMIHANDSSVLAISHSWTEITGYTLQDIPTISDWTEKAYGEKKEDVRSYINTVYDSTQRKAEGEYRVRCSDGNERIWDFSSVGLGAMPDGRRMAISIAVDVTERNQAVEELEQHRNQLEKLVSARTAELKNATSVAEKANLAKSDFLSSMSHELRSPLNAILGFAQLMESDSPPPTPSQKEGITQILQAGWHLLTLINEILDLAKVESGRVPLSQEPVSLAEVILECQGMTDPQAQQRGIDMRFPQFDTPYFVNADRTRLKQVLINLLSNAIKYNSAQGMVEVTCAESAPGRIRVSIRDTGEGLLPEQLAQLFQPFDRLGQERGAEEGTGIGLVMAKQLVELMGGEIGVESTLGTGSVFWFELISVAEPKLPPEAGEAERMAVPTIPRGERLSTLLYVEDNPANLKLVERIIARRPHTSLLSAVNGNLGIQLARDNHPDVILMDINLPGMNGTEALKILRSDIATAHIPVIALSANAMPLDVELGLKAGFLNYITKPIKVDEFMQAVDVALEFSKSNAGRSAKATQARELPQTLSGPDFDQPVAPQIFPGRGAVQGSCLP